MRVAAAGTYNLELFGHGSDSSAEVNVLVDDKTIGTLSLSSSDGTSAPLTFTVGPGLHALSLASATTEKTILPPGTGAILIQLRSGGGIAVVPSAPTNLNCAAGGFYRVSFLGDDNHCKHLQCSALHAERRTIRSDNNRASEYICRYHSHKWFYLLLRGKRNEQHGNRKDLRTGRHLSLPIECAIKPISSGYHGWRWRFRSVLRWSDCDSLVDASIQCVWVQRIPFDERNQFHTLDGILPKRSSIY